MVTGGAVVSPPNMADGPAAQGGCAPTTVVAPSDTSSAMPQRRASENRRVRTVCALIRASLHLLHNPKNHVSYITNAFSIVQIFI